LSQDEIKTLLMATAKDIGGNGWNPKTGAGIIQAKSAYDALSLVYRR
jgi:hypothetical protein